MSARADMVFTTAIIGLDDETQHAINEFIITKKQTGVETLRKYVEIEIVHFPKCKSEYEALGDDENKLFWSRVDYIDKLMEID